jgi:lipopolysaccharide export system permease protein
LFNGVLLYFLYSNLLGAGRELIEQGRLSAAVGLWPVHLLMLALAAALAVAQSPRVMHRVAALRRRQSGG